VPHQPSIDVNLLWLLNHRRTDVTTVRLSSVNTLRRGQPHSPGHPTGHAKPAMNSTVLTPGKVEGFQARPPAVHLKNSLPDEIACNRGSPEPVYGNPEVA
jgi:hypothetical protein